jgi:signal transduction histidine kinase
VLHAISDLMIALAYFSIPVGLWFLVRARPDMRNRHVFILFAAFILLCGLTHVIGLITLWAPIYGLQGLVKAATAIASLIAAYSLWPILPEMLGIRALSGLRETNQGMARAIADHDLLVTDFKAARKDLEDFANTVAHDLRSPLRAINGYSQILNDDYANRLDARGCEMLDRMREATLSMSRLTDELLYISQLRQVPLNKSDVNLSEMAHKLIAQLRKDEPLRQVEVSIMDGVIATCDPDLTRIAIRHLLDNAWKFTSKQTGARIEFGEKISDRKRVFYVRDNGVGFDMAYAEKLFQPFQRLHIAGEYDGSGVGLAIVTRVIQRHGGHIEAEAEPGEGTSFTFSL